MRALITGVTGFVGSHLAEHLLACGDEVCGLSQSGTWSNDASDLLRTRVSLYKADLAQEPRADLHRFVVDWKPEVIYHLAAISVPADCGADEPSPIAIAANVDGTRNLQQLLLAQATRPRVVFSSSCYVYSKVSNDQPLVSENYPCEPSTGYGATKLAAEQILLDAARNQSLDVVIARSFQHTGPGQSPRMIVPDWARQLAIQSTEPIQAICLDTFLDLTDVRDVACAYRKLAVAGRTGEIYNAGSSISYRSGNLLDRMMSFCDSSRPVVELSPGRRQHPIANIERITIEIGWRPRISIDQTLRDVLQFWRDKVGVHR